jgi:hypothetical protein
LTLIEEIEIIKEKITLREWILGELKKYESKYGILTTEFVYNWRNKKIPEPEEHMILEEFLEWEGLFESLEKVENELKELEKRIREN